MEHDLVVIGAGAAGMPATRTAARLRRTVTLVQDGPVGGDCTFTGCVRSKTLIESAAGGEPFDAAMRRVHATVGRIAETETADVLCREGSPEDASVAVQIGDGSPPTGTNPVAVDRWRPSSYPAGGPGRQIIGRGRVSGMGR